MVALTLGATMDKVVEVFHVAVTDSSADVTPKQEAFAQAYVELGNAAAAYRRAYSADGMKTETIWAEASNLKCKPHVAKRIRELRDAAAAATLVRAIDLIRDDYDIATADPNELISLVIESCRHCHGVDHKFQWIDTAEYARAYAEFMQAYDAWATIKPRKGGSKPPEPQPPDMDGGFGFSPSEAPDLSCPHCFGKGCAVSIPRDTTKLSPAARKLYKGVKQKKDGEIEILMHDQAAARDRLYRALGAYKDGAQVPPVELPDQKAPIDSKMSDADAAKEYLRMVGR